MTLAPSLLTRAAVSVLNFPQLPPALPAARGRRGAPVRRETGRVRPGGPLGRGHRRAGPRRALPGPGPGAGALAGSRGPAGGRSPARGHPRRGRRRRSGRAGRAVELRLQPELRRERARGLEARASDDRRGRPTATSARRQDGRGAGPEGAALAFAATPPPDSRPRRERVVPPLLTAGANASASAARRTRPSGRGARSSASADLRSTARGLRLRSGVGLRRARAMEPRERARLHPAGVAPVLSRNGAASFADGVCDPTQGFHFNDRPGARPPA